MTNTQIKKIAQLIYKQHFGVDIKLKQIILLEFGHDGYYIMFGVNTSTERIEYQIHDNKLTEYGRYKVETYKRTDVNPYIY